MKFLYTFILALGFGAIVIEAAEVKEAAHARHQKADNDLEDALYWWEIDQVINALERGANPNTISVLDERTKEYNTIVPLNYFIELINKAQINDLYKKEIALKIPMENMAIAIITVLVERGADVNAKINGVPLLIQALRFKNISVAEELINLSADVNQRFDKLPDVVEPGIPDTRPRLWSNATPLLWAARLCQVEAAELLLNKKADITAIDDDGHDVIYYAKHPFIHVEVNSGESIEDAKKRGLEDYTKRGSAIIQMIENERKIARQALQQVATPYITRDPASLAADYFTGESAEESAIRASKSPQEESEEE